MNIILFGPQGCGKGTQAAQLVKKYGFTHISPGELFRQEAAKGTELGKLLASYTNQGKLVPKELNRQIVKEAIEKANKTNIILDGYPRNQEQADFLDGFLPIDAALEIHISDEEAIKRISARLQCQNCKTGYNSIYIKPKQEGVCDQCGGKLIQRDDDKPEAVKARLKTYHKQTEPLIDFYRKKSIFQEVNGEQPIPEVFADVEKALKLG